jgi:hypothetical protein
LAAIVALVDRRGRNTGRVVTLRDVTERRGRWQNWRARDAAETVRAKSQFLAMVPTKSGR